MKTEGKFRKKDSVKVKTGILDPDHNLYDLTDWQGRIQSIERDEEANEWLCEIAWDSITLKAMPQAFVSDCVINGYDFSTMFLGENDLIHAIERDKLSDVKKCQDIIEDAHRWDDMGEQGKRIAAVIQDCVHENEMMDVWFEYLENNVKLPCKVIYTGDSSRNLRNGTEILLNGIIDSDDMYGVIASGKVDRSAVQFTLCEVELDQITPDNQAIHDYVVWFANR